MNEEIIYGIVVMIGLVLIGMAFGIAIQPIFNDFNVPLWIGIAMFVAGILFVNFKDKDKDVQVQN